VPLTITLIIIIAFSSIVQSYQTQALHTARDERRQASRRARDAGKELEKSRAKAKKAQETEASRRRRAEETYQTHLDSVNSRLSQMGREAEDAKKEAEVAARGSHSPRTPAASRARFSLTALHCVRAAGRQARGVASSKGRLPRPTHSARTLHCALSCTLLTVACALCVQQVAFRISGRHGSPKGGSVHHEPLPDVHMPSTWHSASPNCSREASSADHSRENSRAVTGRRGSRKGSIIDALFHTPGKPPPLSLRTDSPLHSCTRLTASVTVLSAAFVHSTHWSASVTVLSAAFVDSTHCIRVLSAAFVHSTHCIRVLSAACVHSSHSSLQTLHPCTLRCIRALVSL
jgi:hypothetical protein